MSTQVSNDKASTTSSGTAIPFRLELVVIPIADFDRAKAFYASRLGWRVDAEANLDSGYRLMQLTPPGSNTSIMFGTEVTAAQPGSADGLFLVVDDLEAARAELVSAGVEVTEPFHDAGGGLGGAFHIGTDRRAAGPDPQHRSYGTYASFDDPEGNRWFLQEITERLPGRV